MADILQTISSNYVAMGSLYATAGKKYENVDPALFEGTWRGKYADGKMFAVSVSNMDGFRATAKYEGGGTVKYSERADRQRRHLPGRRYQVQADQAGHRAKSRR